MIRKMGVSILFLLPSFLYSENIEKLRDFSFQKIFNEVIEKASKEFPKVSSTKNKKNQEKDPRYYIKVVANDRYERTKLLELGVDIFNISDTYVEGLVHKDLLSNLSEKEFKILNKKEFSEWINEKDFPAQDSAYHNYTETYQVLRGLSEKYSNVSYLFSIGKSYEGRDIWALRINTTETSLNQSKKPGIVLVGNHHAREHLSNEMVLLFAVYLLDNKDNPEIKKYIDTLDIYLIPMLNPDGVEYDIQTGSYKWWRKNTNKIDSTKVVGVDLNRNYDFEWCKAGASTNPSSDTYCGKSAFSEPETKLFRDFLVQRRNIKTLLSYHSYSSLVLYPWGGRDESVPDEKDRNTFIKHATQMAKILGYRAMQSNELYIATGDMADWAYDKLKIFAFTIELEGNSFYPGASIIQTAFDKNKKAAIYLMSVTENPYQ